MVFYIFFNWSLNRQSPFGECLFSQRFSSHPLILQITRIVRPNCVDKSHCKPTTTPTDSTNHGRNPFKTIKTTQVWLNGLDQRLIDHQTHTRCDGLHLIKVILIFACQNNAHLRQKYDLKSCCRLCNGVLSTSIHLNTPCYL